MLKLFLASEWFCPQKYIKLLIAVLLVAPIIITPLQATKAAPVGAAIMPSLAGESDSQLTQLPTVEEEFIDAPAQVDPLDSPYPIPWNWVMTTHADVSSKRGSGLRYYRSQSLLSPDGNYAAYSRIQMQVQPELYRSRVSSVMFVENLQTGELQVVSAASPLADHPLVVGENADIPGNISIITPVAWSKTGSRLLARQFEGLFSSSDASDFAVIWNRQENRTNTVAPSQAEYNHEISILLGWSKSDPNQVLFRAGNLGDEIWPLWAVADDGKTVAVNDIAQPIVFGELFNQIWSGPQVAYR